MYESQSETRNMEAPRRQPGVSRGRLVPFGPNDTFWDPFDWSPVGCCCGCGCGCGAAVDLDPALSPTGDGEREVFMASPEVDGTGEGWRLGLLAAAAAKLEAAGVGCAAGGRLGGGALSAAGVDEEAARTGEASRAFFGGDWVLPLPFFTMRRADEREEKRSDRSHRAVAQ